MGSFSSTARTKHNLGRITEFSDFVEHTLEEHQRSGSSVRNTPAKKETALSGIFMELNEINETNQLHIRR